ncbi:hypothetical protein VTK73DRAFT_837 [Phialemonium thermophilum]|uniref:MPN domain-containing protein n=1 Tax=Phialemonium thermophilum TaxID=223376 RepID=A0ABR3XCC0_9PEZI
MDAPQDLVSHRPMSSKEIAERANDYEWNPNVAFKYWARAADTVYREGLNYMREGDLPNAYLLYLRHSSLVLDHIGKHPQAKDPESKAALRPLLKRMPVVLEQLEKMRPQIDRAYEEWLKVSAAQRDIQKSQQPLSPQHAWTSEGPALSWKPTSRAKVLDARKHPELAVKLAKKEIRRRDAARRARISEEEEQRRREAGLWEDWSFDALTESGVPEGQDQQFSERWDSQPPLSTATLMDGPEQQSWDQAGLLEEEYGRPYEFGDYGAFPEAGGPEEQDLQQQMEATHQMLNRAGHAESDGIGDGLSGVSSLPITHTYQYPSISMPSHFAYPSESVDWVPSSPTVHDSARPPRPPKMSLSRLHPDSSDPTPPMIPDKEPLDEAYEPPPPYESLASAPPKAVDAPEKKKRFTFRPAAHLENRKPLRPVFLPSQLRHSFLRIAEQNTRKGLETCGILCGSLINNGLFISCLLIPEQKSTSDTCETENESAMLEYCISQDLIIVGWIHTHPTQTCFMSSRDLHTQAGYQVMMPESIAIVCAPRFTPSWGIFRLTDPPGLPHILQCTRSETFHQHSIDNIYTDASNPPGHVFESSSLEFYVEDLRPRKK